MLDVSIGSTVIRAVQCVIAVMDCQLMLIFVFREQWEMHSQHNFATVKLINMLLLRRWQFLDRELDQTAVVINSVAAKDLDCSPAVAALVRKYMAETAIGVAQAPAD